MDVSKGRVDRRDPGGSHGIYTQGGFCYTFSSQGSKSDIPFYYSDQALPPYRNFVLALEPLRG